MMSFGTNFETHGYTEEHSRPVHVVMRLFGDENLDVVHNQAKAPAEKDFIAGKTCTIASGKAPGAVIEQATISLDSQVWKSLEDSLPPSCTAWI